VKSDSLFSKIRRLWKCKSPYLETKLCRELWRAGECAWSLEREFEIWVGELKVQKSKMVDGIFHSGVRKLSCVERC
jgi:hypothetical protein